MEHKQLLAWQKAMDLTEKIYTITKEFPSNEQFGLISQIRRSAISIPSNLAEGSSRDAVKEYIRFLNISLGSLSELETQLLISLRLKYIDNSKVFEDEILNVKKLILGIKRYLKTKK